MSKVYYAGEKIIAIANIEAVWSEADTLCMQLTSGEVVREEITKRKVTEAVKEIVEKITSNE